MRTGATSSVSCAPILCLLLVPLAMGMILAQAIYSLLHQHLLTVSQLSSHFWNSLQQILLSSSSKVSHRLCKIQHLHPWVLAFSSAALPELPSSPSSCQCCVHCPSLISLPSCCTIILQAGGLELNKYSPDLFIHSQALRPGEIISSLSLTSCLLQAIKPHLVIPVPSSIICLTEVYLFGKAPSLDVKTALYNSIFYPTLYIFYNVLFGF